MTLVAVMPRYADGTETTEPLIGGRNVDCGHIPFARVVHRRTLTHDIVSELPVSPAALALATDAAVGPA